MRIYIARRVEEERSQVVQNPEEVKPEEVKRNPIPRK